MEAGCVFDGAYSKLPTQHAKVLWEVEVAVDRVPPRLRPLKPKLWLLCNVKLEPDKVYLLE